MSKDIAEAWDETKPRGRPKHKALMLRNKPRPASSSWSASSIEDLQGEGETKKYERKRFYPKDHKF